MVDTGKAKKRPVEGPNQPLVPAQPGGTSSLGPEGCRFTHILTPTLENSRLLVLLQLLLLYNISSFYLFKQRTEDPSCSSNRCSTPIAHSMAVDVRCTQVGDVPAH